MKIIIYFIKIKLALHNGTVYVWKKHDRKYYTYTKIPSIQKILALFTITINKLQYKTISNVKSSLKSQSCITDTVQKLVLLIN